MWEESKSDLKFSLGPKSFLVSGRSLSLCSWYRGQVLSTWGSSSMMGSENGSSRRSPRDEMSSEEQCGQALAVGS